MKRLLILVTALALLATSAFASRAKTARLQVIHNAADPAAAVVDIYVNGELLLNDFAFRAATPFIDVPAGVQLNIGVAPGTSSSSADILATIPVTLQKGKIYVAIANGVLDPNAFASNPENKSIGFTLFAKDKMREKATWRRNVDLNIFHGATDAPAVDVRVTGKYSWNLVSGLSYGEFSGYKDVSPRQYQINITPAGDENTVVAAYQADLTGLAGGAAVVFASGFLNPAANQEGAAFGLFAALPNGTVIELPQVTTARLQVIHNAADPAAEMVDVYVNGGLLLDNFAFRTATPFVDVPAGTPLEIGVAGSNSANASEALATFTVTLTPGRTYVAMANGVLDPNGFAENPDGLPIGFSLYPQEGIAEKSPYGHLVNLVAFHGASDAPTVDVVPQLGKVRIPIFNDLSYGSFSERRLLPAWKYILDVTPGGDNKTVVASFVADLRGLAGGAAVVFASGFLNPSANGDGSAFGLFAALADGTVLELPAASATETAVAKLDNSLPSEFALDQNYPNPFNPTTTISFSLPTPSDVSLKVYNVIGQEVASLVEGPMGAGAHTVQFDATNLSSGIYFYRLTAGGVTQSKKMSLLK
ncbi:MAG: DUF4397 domain-containing protein [bacterium]|nr:DUF4397 domain-containing protein [bacterium]